MKTASTHRNLAIQRELLLVGGGHAHVAVIRHFGMKPVSGVRVTLLSRDVHTPYSGMLPGLVAGHYTHDECHIDLRRLCTANGVRLIHGTLEGLDITAQTVDVSGRGSLAWDLLSLNTGSSPALDAIPGAREHGCAVKPIDRFLSQWEEHERHIHSRAGPHRIVVVGGGAAAVEMALAIAWRLRQARPRAPDVSIALATAGQQLLEGHGDHVRRTIAAKLFESGIETHFSSRVAGATATHLELESGRHIECDFPVWAVHAGAPVWPREAGLACDAAGFVRVEQTLRSISHARVFAAGDIASLPEPVPKSGVHAVREGDSLARNLVRALEGNSLRPHRPQRQFLSLLATGDRYAVASRGAFHASGKWVWNWKNRIDRTFMAMYQPAALPAAVLAADEGMRCGGCAAKVDADTLASVLRAIAPGSRESVHHGIASAEDAAVIAPPPGQLLVQSVDYFRAFIDDPWLLGRIATVHALGDLHAMGATPHSALAIATVPHGAPRVVRETLTQLMLGARSALEAESLTLAGGHSSEGAELGFGLSVNGFVLPEALLLKSGIVPGHALVLTKALGTGVLFAANMAGAAAGNWIEDALSAMQQGHGTAVRILRHHGVSACTDVTGFGLLGHLGEMLRASGLGARLDMSAIPALPGARECLLAGYRSSLHAGNASALSSMESLDRLDQVTQALLVDPQTAGGLLAALPEARAQECVEELRNAGYAAAVIGFADGGLPPGKVSTG